MKNNIRKSVKRWLALVMTAIMVFAMAPAAMAATTTVNTVVTIKNSDGDTTSNVYKAYKVLDFNVSDGKYVDVEVCSPFTSAIPGTYSDIDAWMAAYATESFDNSDMQTLANTLAALVTVGTTSEAATSTNGVITLPSTGYYLLVETEHNDGLTIETRYILIAAEGTAKEIDLKEAETSITKKIVLETETDPASAVDGATTAGALVDDDVVAIGDTVTYQIEVVIPSYPAVVSDYINDNSGTDLTFKITDVMSAGLTYSSASLAVKGGSALAETTNYTISTSGGSGSETTITIDLNTATVLANGGNTVVITLTATLNENANYGETGNPNSVDLTYTNEWDTQGKPADVDKTPEDTVITYTGQFFIQKTTDAATPKNLPGAKFKIVTENDSEATGLTFTKVSDGVYRYDKSGAVTELEADSDGKIEIRGLNNGTYYAVETQAPDGYNIDKTPQQIILKAAKNTGVQGLENAELVSESTTATTGSAANTEIQNNNKITWTVNSGKTTDTVKITNHQGTTLPGTGGIGTTLFTFGGLALVILAAIMFIVYTKKQRKQA